MMNLFSALELGKNSILTKQKVFQVIGHNIANVNTPGYSRQTVNLESVAPGVLGPLSSGRGVNISAINSVRDRFITSQIIDRKGINGYYGTLSSNMTVVESLFNQTQGNGLSDQMSDFFNKWADVANNPTNIPSRRSLVSSAGSFARNMANSYQTLIDQQEITNGQIVDTVKEINALAAQIASLNRSIGYADGTGQPAHDLIDQRDIAIKSLSEKVGIAIYPNQNNDSITIDVAGRPLVTDHLYNELSVVRNPANSNYYDVFIGQYGGPPLNITSRVQNGNLQALLTMRDENIPLYREELDNLAFGLMYNINTHHQGGFALDTLTTGQNFFEMATGNGQLTAVAGNTATFSAAINTTLTVGDMITIGGQTRRITGIPAANQVTTETPFNPDPPAVLPAAWEYATVQGAAARLAVNTDLIDDPALVAASALVDPGPPASGAVGNNAVALAISALMEQNSTVDSNRDGSGDYGTFHEYFHRTLSTIGNHSASAQYELEANESMTLFLENKRDEISGVSLDEEAADLMRFEKSYQAIAQFVSKINQMTDILIQLGRY
jgi:flagellar hook-associated protein 1 FlgK